MKKTLTEERLRELAGLTTGTVLSEEQNEYGWGDTRIVGRGELPTRTRKPADPAVTAKLPTAGDSSPSGGTGSNYRESERLFRHFFGHLDDNTLEMVMHTDPEMEEIIVQLYGWQLPGYRQNYDEPGTDTIRLAQDFEKEGKKIDGNEDEFLQRLHNYIYKKGKEAFDKTPNTQKSSKAHFDAIRHLVKDHGEAHPDTIVPAHVRAYERRLMKKYPESYKWLYQGYLTVHD